MMPYRNEQELFSIYLSFATDSKHFLSIARNKVKLAEQSTKAAVVRINFPPPLIILRRLNGKW